MWRIDRVIQRRNDHDLLWCSPPDSALPATNFARWYRGDTHSCEFEYFQRLAAISATVSNANLIPLTAHDLDAEQPLLVFPRLDAIPINDWLPKQASQPMRSWLVWVARQLMQALDGLHSAGYVHGNVRPEHLLLCGERRVVLVGLGSCEQQGAVTCLPRHSTRFDAPETSQIEFSASPAQDVFSAAELISVLLGDSFRTSPIGQVMLDADPSRRPSAKHLATALTELERELFGDSIRPSTRLAA